MDEKSIRKFVRLHEEYDRTGRLLRNATLGIDPGTLEQMRRAAELGLDTSTMVEAARSWRSFGQILAGHSEELRKRLAALDLSRMGGLSSAITPQLEALRRMTGLERIVPAFRLPHIHELASLGTTIKQVIDSARMRKALLTEDQMIGTIKAMQTAWFEPAGAAGLVESIAKLSTLGSALEMPAYSPASSETIRALLGDWRRVTIPKAVYSDWQARSDFYRQTDFDISLVALPEPAFTESLHRTSIWTPESFTPTLSEAMADDAGVGQPDDIEDAVRWRMIQAFDAVTRFEREVRTFIASVMSSRYGTAWYRQRVPGDVLAGWKDKRKKAVANGQPRRDLFEYADFTDYLRIITRSDNWREVFSRVFISKEDVTVSFHRLYPLRNATTHSREITKEDFIILFVETRQVRRAIVGFRSEPLDGGDEE